MKLYRQIYAKSWLACAVAIVSPAEATDISKQPPTDVYGNVILQSDGQRVNFNEGQLRGKSPDSTLTKTPGLPAENDVRAPAILSPPSWTYGILQSGLGVSNIRTARNSIGDPEIYLGSGGSTFGTNQYWIALRYNTVTASYDQFFTSEKYGAAVSRIECGDVTGDSRPEIIIGLSSGQIHVYDQETKEKLTTFNSAVSSLAGLAVYNVDSSPKCEVLVSGNSKVSVYSEGVHQWTVSGVSGSDLDAGQMDGDPAIEIAVGGGQVIDAATKSIQWANTQQFGARIDVGDIDGDGLDEIVSAESWYNVWAFDVDAQLPKWSYRADLDITALALTDVDADGILEVAIGDGQWGDVFGIDGQTKALKWKIANPEHSVADIVVEDVDNDGKREVIWAAGYSSTGRDVLCVANPVTKVIEWQNVHLDGPLVGPEIGDLDGDGKLEIVVASYESQSSYNSGRILVFDSGSLSLRGMSAPVCKGLAWTGLHDLKLRDVDGDGNSEILIAADTLYDGTIEIYDFSPNNAFTLKWFNNTQTRPSGSPFYSVDAADINGDGKIEILGGVGAEHTGSQGINLYVYSNETGAELWHSYTLGSNFWGRITDVEIADVDSTPGLEMLGIPHGSNLYIFDGKTYNSRAIISGAFTNLQVLDKSIFLTDATGKLFRYDYNGVSYTLTNETQLISGVIDGFKVRTVSPLVVQFGSAGKFHIYDSGSITLQSQNFGSPYGSRWESEISAGSYCVTANRLPAPNIRPEPEITTGTVNDIYWGSLPNAREFWVETSTDSTFSNPTASGWKTGLTYQFQGLTPESMRYFRVKARSLDGLLESPWSATTQSLHVSAGPTAALGWSLYD